MDRTKDLQIGRAGRVQCHQISSTRNAKAASQNEKKKKSYN